jgi:hypothetical protein
MFRSWARVVVSLGHCNAHQKEKEKGKEDPQAKSQDTVIGFPICWD